ncbi:Glycosyltransferase family 25 [Lasiodiplodia theobromae]|uniref:Glycosyltransferase family 25 n=1 Tax=Lasiodiplodia theobromae TaxID=45133 RepID=UPI0015C3EAC6|nr:Glycosyltransferase family 25 [Lasiodiplodia theobromae]KAF4535134.1 Glycosyltransferase family 25 [Lasiodiplodia theobromae]
MSYHSPHQSQAQFHFDASTPPPPPPKPSAHSSGRGTPLTGPPLPPTPAQIAQAQAGPASQSPQTYGGQQPAVEDRQPPIELPEEGWLPNVLKDKNTADLQAVLESPELQKALAHSPGTAHPSIAASTAPLGEALAANIALAESLKNLESHLQHQRQHTQSRLLSLRALEGQWRAKQAEQDAALKDFSPPALYQRLSTSITEQESLCRGLEESFLEGEGGGQATEREVAEFPLDFAFYDVVTAAHDKRTLPANSPPATACPICVAVPPQYDYVQHKLTNQMLLPTSRLPLRPGRAVFIFAGVTLLLLWHFHLLSARQPVQIAETLVDGQANANIANSTLGFQTIIAISSENASAPGAWRQRGLLAATHRTGLEVKVHQSRRIPDDELRAFMQHTSKTGESPRIGSAKAWLAHLDALKYVLAHNISTALILEDDADWDVRIRKLLAPNAAVPSLVREILHDNDDDTTSDNNSTLPYSLAYDILWLGHCASVKTPHSRQLDTLDDAASLPPANSLRALADRYAYTPLPDGTRSIMRSPGPTCTYAYAVTRPGAARILELASGGGAAFDNEVGAGCAKGEEKGGLRCVSVAPELFHHQRVIREDGADSSLVDGMNWGKAGEGELKTYKQKTVGKEKVGTGAAHDGRRFITFNIMYSARCNADRGDGDLVECMPTDEELDRYTT